MRTRRSVPAVLCLAVLALATGCGGDEADDTRDTGPVPSMTTTSSPAEPPTSAPSPPCDVHDDSLSSISAALVANAWPRVSYSVGASDHLRQVVGFDEALSEFSGRASSACLGEETYRAMQEAWAPLYDAILTDGSAPAGMYDAVADAGNDWLDTIDIAGSHEFTYVE